jgi:hypothetical protein
MVVRVMGKMGWLLHNFYFLEFNNFCSCCLKNSRWCMGLWTIPTCFQQGINHDPTAASKTTDADLVLGHLRSFVVKEKKAERTSESDLEIKARQWCWHHQSDDVFKLVLIAASIESNGGRMNAIDVVKGVHCLLVALLYWNEMESDGLGQK